MNYATTPIYTLICKQVANSNGQINALLIACTELSILLEGEKTKLEHLGLSVVDTEEFFIDKVVEDILLFTPVGINDLRNCTSTMNSGGRF